MVSVAYVDVLSDQLKTWNVIMAIELKIRPLLVFAMLCTFFLQNMCLLNWFWRLIILSIGLSKALEYGIDLIWIFINFVNKILMSKRWNITQLIDWSPSCWPCRFVSCLALLH